VVAYLHSLHIATAEFYPIRTLGSGEQEARLTGILVKGKTAGQVCVSDQRHVLPWVVGLDVVRSRLPVYQALAGVHPGLRGRGVCRTGRNARDTRGQIRCEAGLALHHRVEADGLVGPHGISGFRPRVLGVARPCHGGSGGAVSHSDAEPTEALEALSWIRSLGIPQLQEKGGKRASVTCEYGVVRKTTVCQAAEARNQNEAQLRCPRFEGVSSPSTHSKNQACGRNGQEQRHAHKRSGKSLTTK
jgi:hypothetical protein